MSATNPDNLFVGSSSFFYLSGLLSKVSSDEDSLETVGFCREISNEEMQVVGKVNCAWESFEIGVQPGNDGNHFQSLAARFSQKLRHTVMFIDRRCVFSIYLLCCQPGLSEGLV